MRFGRERLWPYSAAGKSTRCWTVRFARERRSSSGSSSRTAGTKSDAPNSGGTSVPSIVPARDSTLSVRWLRGSLRRWLRSCRRARRLFDLVRRATQRVDDCGPFPRAQRIGGFFGHRYHLFDAGHRYFDLLIRRIDDMVRCTRVDAHATRARPQPDACLLPECPDTRAKTGPRSAHETLRLPHRLRVDQRAVEQHLDDRRHRNRNEDAEEAVQGAEHEDRHDADERAHTDCMMHDSRDEDVVLDEMENHRK